MAQPTIGSEFAGHRIDEVAGRGGMGVVYRATELRLKRVVALKMVAPELAEDAEFRQRFQRESELAASLDDPNVIPIYHAGEEDGQLYITMRFVQGTDLKAVMDQRGRLEPRFVAEIVAQVASGLDEAHTHGLVHRDVKPANVLIQTRAGSDHVYLTDFGLTKRTGSGTAMTATGMFMGTIDYVAPEQVQGAPVDARTDVYSLGAVLFHAITGRVPYPRDNDLAKMFAHGTEDAPSPLSVVPDLSPEFDAVIARAMAKDPDDRYMSAGDLGDAALQAARRQEVTRAERSVARGPAAPADTKTKSAESGRSTELALPSPPDPPPPSGAAQAAAARRPAGAPARVRRRRVLAIGAGAAVLVVAVGALLLLSGGGGDSGGSATNEPALTKSQWIAQADQICTDTRRKEGAAIAELGQNPTTQDQQAFVRDQLVPIIEDENDSLRALPPPSGDEAIVGAILDAAQRGTDELAANPGTTFNPYRKATQLARSYGLQVCGEA